MSNPRLNEHLYIKPFFVEKDGVEFEAGSIPQLIGKVVAYRKGQGLPTASVTADVVNQLCNRQPHLCNWPSDAPVPPQKGQTKGGLNTRILNWASGIAEKYLMGKLRYVRDRKEVERRFAICASCPRAQDWATSCAACRADVTRLEQEVKSPLGPMGIRLDKASELKGCGALGEDPRVSIFLDEQKVPSDNLPGNCWRKE
jgi:hypothetical protein